MSPHGDRLVIGAVIAETDWQTGKEVLARIVAMLTRMMVPSDQVREPETVYGYE